jgi:hypothetical protein
MTGAVLLLGSVVTGLPLAAAAAAAKLVWEVAPLARAVLGAAIWRVLLAED